jgi:hypothetical protein
MFQIEDVIESRFPAFGAQPPIIAKPLLAMLKKLLREDDVNAPPRAARRARGPGVRRKDSRQAERLA